MLISITGSHGFIGTNLREYLTRQIPDVEFDCWDNKIDKPLSDFMLYPQTDYVIHLAANANVRESIDDPNKFWHNNLELSQEVFNQCKMHKTRLAYASTSCVHEWWKNPYGISKKAMEHIAPKNSVGLRFTTVYGPGAPSYMLIPKLQNGGVEYVTDHVRDFVHVEDVCSAMWTALKSDYKGVVDVGSGQSITIKELAEKFGHKDLPVKPGADYEMMDNSVDISAMKSLGWSPTKFL